MIQCDAVGGNPVDIPWQNLLMIWPDRVEFEAVKWLFNWQMYAAVFFLLLLSQLYPVERMDREYHRSMMQDYLYGVLHTLLVVPTLAVILTCQQILTEYYIPGVQLKLLQQLPIPAQIGIAFIVSDFLGFLSHILKHKIRTMWYFHMTHHSQKYLNPFTTKRTHIVEHLFSKVLIRWLPLAVMGSPLEVWLLFYWACAFWDYFIHSNLRIKLGILRWLLVTPQYHRIHHSRLPQHHDKNFGDKLVVWDLLFGTACMDPSVTPPTGIPDPGYPYRRSDSPVEYFSVYLRQWCYPFSQVWRLINRRITSRERAVACD